MLYFLGDYDSEESWKHAANKRKFLFDRTLKEYDSPNLLEGECDGNVTHR